MPRKIRAGDLVEVRSPDEILDTLDESGSVDKLPFMPEMLAFAGQRFRVSKRAHKTCDTVHQTGGRKMRNTVHLDDIRCNGAGHDGCKATCLLFWKADWLKRVDSGDKSAPSEPVDESTAALTDLLTSNTRKIAADNGKTVYRCQATALFEATEALNWWAPTQYLEDLMSGNVSLGQMFRVWFFHGLHKLMRIGIGYRLWRTIYDYFQTKVGGYRYPFRRGQVPEGENTPVEVLDLQPGERVRIKSHDDILKTIDQRKTNRGMRFDEEMAPFCGKTYEVLQRVDRIIHETTGEMIEMKSPSVILGGVVCRSEMSNCRLFCPRAIPSYWREIWLERIGAGVTLEPESRVSE